LVYLYDSTGSGARYKITGIAHDPPPNAHFTFSMLGSFKTVEVARPELSTAEGWTDSRYYTYLLLREDADYHNFSRKIARFSTSYADGHLPRAAYSFNLQRLRDIHLHSHLQGEIAPNGSIGQVYLFSTIGLLILLLAGINYTNLATARSLSRAKEVSIKKVIGAVPAQLVIQYLAESVCVALLALLFAGLISASLQPFFVQLTGKTLSLLASPSLLVLLAGITFLLGLLSGAYPALVLSRFKPARVLKGAFQSGAQGIALRQSLIVVQFMITLLLITSIVIIYCQMRYIKHKDLGFTKDALVFLRLNGNADVIEGYDAFKQELGTSTLIGGVTASRSGITNGLETGSATTLDGKHKPIQVTTATLEADADYLATYGIQLVAGQNFTPRAAGDTRKQIILNEQAVKKFGWENAEKALGKPFALDDQPGIVVGVVRNFHYHSLQHTIGPLAIVLRDAYFSRITLKITGHDMGQSLAFVQKVWRKHFPVALFDYDFVDHLLAEQYQAEERFSTLMLYFSVLSLVIACLGLYGLIAYTTTQKTREIGIRKTLGASVTSIVVLLSGDFLKLVMLACLVALPLAWYLMRLWLQDFAYKIVMEWWMFGAAVMLVLGIALFTVCFQTLKAALANPVKSLRSE
jgi:putative ABC transport system permease protein